MRPSSFAKTGSMTGRDRTRKIRTTGEAVDRRGVRIARAAFHDATS
jgi:hypothetical protein